MFDIYDYNDKYRFTLGNNDINPLICIGVNPSKATKLQSDRTIDKIIKIAKYNNYRGFIMLNLYAFVSTSFSKIPKNLEMNCHKENLKRIESIFKQYSNSNILACWGNMIDKRWYLKENLKDIVKIYHNESNGKWFCLEILKSGNPKHPLYVKYNTKLKKFDINSYI